MTLAPELPGATDILQAAAGADVVVSVGHTDADYDTAADSFRAGASHVTHAFNGMRPFHHRDPGPVFAALAQDGVTIELIADGVHLHPATVRGLISAARPHQITLVSDGVPPAGLEAGTFALGDDEARIARGSVLLPDGTIAGSAATLDQIIRNVVSWQAADLPATARMASTTPARVLHLADRKGSIAPGYDPDLVALDPDLNVAMTWIQGRVAYSRLPQ
jgi:N-acetylglucosamine-6-phosphate deacetylase